VFPFFEARNVPARVNFLCSTEREAIEGPRGDIVLGYCECCGFMTNIAFDPAKFEYGAGYENPLHCSEVFREYADHLADDLIERFSLRGKTIIEVGSGDGYFLHQLCERGMNKGIGFDPSSTDSPAWPASGASIRIIKDYYSERYATLDADFLVCRHTLEHVPNPMDLLGPLRRSIGARTDTGVFIEVPNGTYTLENFFVWDIIYEHASYFTRDSLEFCLRFSGLRVTRSYETYSGQFLCAEAVPAVGLPRKDREDSGTGATPGNRATIDRFSKTYPRVLEEWRLRIERLGASEGRVVVWGAGSKGVMFLNSFDSRGVVECVVDVNSRKHGKFISGTGHEIVGPDRLRDLRPGTVVIANPVYRAEIERKVSSLGLSPDFITL
jgi:hypothetical protein